MAALLFVLLTLARFGVSEGGWCVCRSDMSDGVLQKTLDYACGAGADCTPIQQGGACYNPNTVRAHCSYAANSYYQRKAQAQQACDFSTTATLTLQDPSSNGCTYPASPSAAGASSANTNTNTNTPTSSTTSSGSTTPTTTTTIPGSTTPTTFTPNTGTGTGGILGGSVGPAGNGIGTTDTNGGGAPRAGTVISAILSSLLPLILKHSA